MRVLKNLVKGAAALIGRNHPELITRIRYRLRFHKKLNLDNPENLNEKIQYMSLRTDTSEWTRLTDKYAVREYVKECGLGDILNRLYGVWESAADIDFSNMPDKFVIKTTHGSGDAILVRDRKTACLEEIRKRVDATLHETYGQSALFKDQTTSGDRGTA